jgi:hypothetical protein
MLLNKTHFHFPPNIPTGILGKNANRFLVTEEVNVYYFVVGYIAAARQVRVRERG